MSSEVGKPSTSRRRAAAARALGISRFEAGDFEGARLALSQAVAAGANDRDAVFLLGGLISDHADHAAAAALYQSFLDGPGLDLAPSDQLDWYRLAFDAETRTDTGSNSRSALDLLAAAAAADDWSPILDAARRPAIEALFTTPIARLDLLEQYGYAPAETGLPAAALARIQSIGIDGSDDWQTSRTAERLLHLFGHPEAAYAIERARRVASRLLPERRDRVPAADSELAAGLQGLVILIAGGHPALRRQIARDLTRAQVAAVREIPPAWEGVRGGREVRDRIEGSDVAVLIGRRLAHSTTNQVRSAAQKSGVPVIRAETASINSVRNALERWRGASRTTLE